VIGAHIGNYRIVTELGAGAMGEVYFAEHSVMGRRAAVKVIREELSGNAEMVERFVNEARLVNRIGHPNIVEITDFGQIGSRYYIMMELLEGETLEERLERTSRLSSASVQRIAAQITAALGAAHELGVVHRDLKPENIFLVNRAGETDYVKVLDFGIAKLMGGVSRGTAGTMPGTLLGTPHYMSPEQCHGAEQLDHRTDVYSMGVILYRMLTGELPFDGDTLLNVLYAQANDPPRPLRSIVPELSEHLESVVLKALAKAPDERFQEMSALRAALNGKPLEAPVPAIPPPPPPPPQPPPLAASEPERPKEMPAGDTAQHATDRAPAVQKAQRQGDPTQARRVGSKLAHILVERIRKNRLVLPTMPTATRECLRLVDDPNGGLTKVAAAIGRDPVIAPLVMRRARSALLGTHTPVRTLDQAVARLGARQLRSILLDLCTRRLFESKDPLIRRATRGLWEHSLAVAILARAIARRRRDVDPEAAYLAGLLHDVGKPVAASLLLEAERGAGNNEWLTKDAWLDVIQECHREVGVALARNWELQDEVVHAIARSERYSIDGAGSIASVVCFANALIKSAGIYTGEFDREAVQVLIRDGLILFQLEPEMLDTMMAELRSEESLQAAMPG
jgi:putative nucleotidyltransferase with HDIG domain